MELMRTSFMKHELIELPFVEHSQCECRLKEQFQPTAATRPHLKPTRKAQKREGKRGRKERTKSRQKTTGAIGAALSVVTHAPPILPPPSSPPPPPPPPSPPPTSVSPSPSPSPIPRCRPCRGRKWVLDVASCQCRCSIRAESCSRKDRRLNLQRCRCEAMRT